MTLPHRSTSGQKHDTVIKSGASVDRCIIDKRAVIGRNCTLGIGSPENVNTEFPEQLNSGITLIGKWAEVPDETKIGMNCIVYPMAAKTDFNALSFQDGSTIKNLKTTF